VPEPRVIIVTGLSGAGRSQTAKVLEDVGYFVVDNLPPSLIVDVVDRVGVAEGTRERVGLVVDSRGGVTAAELEAALTALRRRGVRTTVLFLDADDATLARRFEETKRSHPVLEGTVAEKIRRERTTFEEIRGSADVIIDTSELTVHDLRRRVEEVFAGDGPQRRMHVDIVSFGFKKGVPRVVDVMLDVRFLPNPHWLAALRPLTGLHQDVSAYVLGQDDAAEFLGRAGDLLEFLVPRYEAEGKSYLTIGIGCTGGRHRSVAIAEALGTRLRDVEAMEIEVHHRDLESADTP
jgi:UPF0042 nucleotide-binding protein